MASQETPEPESPKLGAAMPPLRRYEYKGVTLESATNPIENIRAMETFAMRDGDIVIVAYPKAGTHLLYEILYGILHGTTRPPNERGFAAGLEFSFQTPTGRDVGHVRLTSAPTSSPRTMSTHLQRRMAPPGLAQPDKDVRVIVVMRNPKDVAVSYYNFERHNPFSQSQDSWDDFYRQFLDGKAVYGPYYDHVLGWWQMRDDPHFLFLKYEDMNRDLTSAVRTIASFLQKNLSDDAVEAVAEACSFQTMKERFSQSSIPYYPHLTRKGKIGDWKNYFTPEQSREFDSEYEDKMADTGLSFDFE
ncbi:sulfotransferase 6B1-like [Branchiostoma lanceolatum]|uniref:sulfotransferase 6B1-like n=1 Tax=Branchiostoma lanceolatum TaxID=7740 RepID=UPI001132EEDC